MTTTAVPREMIRPYPTLWFHPKTKGLYVVHGFTTCSTNGDGDGVECVSYTSLKTGETFHRDTDEFLDGRFAPYAGYASGYVQSAQGDSVNVEIKGDNDG